jgi:transcriptional regulator with XRE-family HTH domain
MPVGTLSAAHAALGESVRQARTSVGYSQERLAEVSGLHRNLISGIERGERNPTYSTLLRVAEGLTSSVCALVCAAEHSDAGEAARVVISRTPG